MSNLYRDDGKTYIFKSKFEKLNFPYSITPENKKQVKDRLEESIAFLKNSYIEVNDTRITLFDCSMGANVQPNKYRAELYNRVETMRKFAKDKGFDTPVFITLTPPSHLKPLKQIKLGKTNSYKLVDNPKFGGSVEFVKESRDFLTQIWRKFLAQRIFKDIKAEFEHNMIYLRTFEPFIDGSCHCHIVAFIPEKYKDRFVNLAKNYFHTRTDIKTDFKGDIGGVVAYLLKYVLKTFKNGQSGELTDIAYWYVYYNIRRFSTSRTLIPMYLYRKIKSFDDFQDLEEMTNLYNDGLISCDLIQNTEKFLSGEKMLAEDYRIDAIIVSIDGFYETTHYVAYQRNDKIKVVFPDKEVGINGEQSKPKSLLPIIKAAIKRKKENIDFKILSWTLKPYSDMTNYQLVTLYVQHFLWYNSPIKIAVLENELLRRGFGYLTGEKERHCLNMDNYQNLANKFGNKGILELPF